MRNRTMRLTVVLLLVIALLTSMCGYAEEASAEPAGMDVSVDEALIAEESEEAALPELSILLYNPPSTTINFAESITLTATVAAAGQTVTWTSSDENVAEVHPNSDGSVAVVGVGEGTAAIACTFGDQTQTYSVTVNPPQTLLISDVEYPSSLRVSGRGWSLGRGTIASIDDLKTLTSAIRNASGELIAEPYTQTFDGGVKSFKIRGIDRYVPFGRISTEGQYIWMLTATDASGRSVTVNLPIQAVAEGETTISRAARKSAPVIKAADGSDGGNAIALQAGEKKSLTATQMPGDAGSGVIWVSYDPAVATVSPEGEITGVGAGTTTVICRTLDNTGFSAGFTVTVNAAPAPAREGNPAPEAQAEAAPAPQGDGRNYAVNSAFAKGIEDWSARGEAEIFEVVNSDGLNWLHIKGDAAPSLADNSNVQGVTQGVFQKYNLHAVPGEAYTLSMRVRGAAADQHCYLNLRWGRSDNSHIANGYHGFTFGADAQTISITVIAPKEADTITINITTNCETTEATVGSNETNEFFITDIKLERGGVPTEWTPAPEDAAPAN